MPPGVTHLAVSVRFQVTHGRIGIGWTRADSDQFVAERYFSVGDEQVTVLRVPVDALPGRLMFRNASPEGPSRTAVSRLDARFETRLPPPYPITVGHLDPGSHWGPVEHGISIFEDSTAVAINRARLEFLERLDLPVLNKRVLDAGCGVGHHTRFYTERGCHVVGVDGRPENIQAMKRLYPSVEGIVGDLQEMEFAGLGTFDVVHCFGLLYHLESPVAALRRLAGVCREFLLIETMVTDAPKPVMVLVDESSTPNQALGGLGCRPSPSFVAMTLDRIGFPHVYGTAAPPRHPDFDFEWRGNLDTTRHGHNLSCVFVASRVALASPHLVELISPD